MRIHRGFTLAELMVVIGIIIVLLSILLPAVHGARESARSAQCANNERNIWHAMEAYATTYDGVLPASATYPTDFWKPGANTRLAYFFASSGNRNIEFDHGAIMRYLGNETIRRSIMLCPNADGAKINYSYVVNGQLLLSDGNIREFQIVRPDHKIVVFEDDEQNLSVSDGHFTLGGDDAPSMHHFRVGPMGRPGTIGRGNYAFADGHVESLFPNDLTGSPKSQKLIDSYAALLK